MYPSPPVEPDRCRLPTTTTLFSRLKIVNGFVDMPSDWHITSNKEGQSNSRVTRQRETWDRNLDVATRPSFHRAPIEEIQDAYDSHTLAVLQRRPESQR